MRILQLLQTQPTPFANAAEKMKTATPNANKTVEVATPNPAKKAKKRYVLMPCRCCKSLAAAGEPFCEYHMCVETFFYTRLSRSEQSRANEIHNQHFSRYCRFLRDGESGYERCMKLGWPIAWEDAGRNKKGQNEISGVSIQSG